MTGQDPAVRNQCVLYNAKTEGNANLTGPTKCSATAQAEVKIICHDIKLYRMKNSISKLYFYLKKKLYQTYGREISAMFPSVIYNVSTVELANGKIITKENTVIAQRDTPGISVSTILHKM